MSRIHFGMQTPPIKTWAEMKDDWLRYEALGFESLWIPDHLIRPFDREEWMQEAWTLLAGLAAVTEKVRLGILVSCNTFRHPALLAKQAVTVDHVSNGRLELGVGAGWFVPEHEMFGIPFPETAELVARYREAVELIDIYISNDVSSYNGTYYQLTEAPCRPGPIQTPRPPLTLGAHGPIMLKIVAKHADRWNTVGTVEQMRERNKRLDDACTAIGRDPKSILRSSLYVPAQMPEENPWASIDAFTDYVGRFREAGMEEFLFQPPLDRSWDVIERAATEVMPTLRETASGARRQDGK